MQIVELAGRTLGLAEAAPQFLLHAMGALRRRMPVTYWTFLCGTLAIAGMVPFSGFYSKDSILAQAAQHSLALFVLGAAVAALTTFYMFRLVFVAFLGAPKSEAAGHAHESPPVIAWPLRILAVFSVIGGLIGIEQLYRLQFPAEPAEHSTSLPGELIAPFVHAPPSRL